MGARGPPACIWEGEPIINSWLVRRLVLALPAMLRNGLLGATTCFTALFGLRVRSVKCNVNNEGFEGVR